MFMPNMGGGWLGIGIGNGAEQEVHMGEKENYICKNNQGSP